MQLTSCLLKKMSVKLVQAQLSARQLPTKRRSTELAVLITGSADAIGRLRRDGAGFCIAAAEIKIRICWSSRS